MRNRSVIAPVIATIIVATLGACSAGGTSASGNAADADSAVTVGLMQQARGDQEPWSGAWDASALTLESANSDVTVTETFDAADPTKAEPVARQLLDQGADALVMSSFQLADVATSLSTEYPDVPMLVTSFGEAQQPNLWLGTASYLEIGYATCWYLTSVSPDGRMGVVAALEDPAQVEVQKGCELGAQAANADSAITTVNTNSYTDQQASREQTQKLLDEGIESIYFVSASAESLGGFALCEQRSANCATWGASSAEYAPTAGVMSVEIDWSVVMQKMVDQARSGELEAEVFNATFQNGGLKAQDFADQDVAQEVKDGFATVLAGLADESIELPESSAHPGLR